MRARWAISQSRIARIRADRSNNSTCPHEGPGRLGPSHSNLQGDGKLYLITVKEIFAASIQPDGHLGPLTLLLGDLPDGGQHGNRTIAFGPDGMLYISVGSTCNACNESNPESATILRASADGKSRTIFNSGLRNTIGFDWHPVTGELWGLDNGSTSSATT
jgi:glucose/arabinose dehydrogenase